MAVRWSLAWGFSLTVCGLLGASAYFAGAGVSALAETALLLDSVDPAARQAARARRQATPGDADVILTRNPFDSATGTLTKKETPAAESEPQAEEPVDPLTVPTCPEIEVYSTMMSEDPLWSTAVVRGPGEERGRVLRVGARVAGWQLAYIGENPLRGGPAVWFEDQSGLCQSVLFGRARAAAAPAAAVHASAPASPARDQAGSRTGTAVLPSELASRIKRVNPGEFLLDRAAVDSILENHAQLLRGSRMTPAWKDGELTGFKLDRITPESLLGRLGFENGDQIEAINGIAMTSPETALQAYTKLRSARELRVRVNRGGRPMQIDYLVR
jgi:general secretion pathway protein C